MAQAFRVCEQITVNAEAAEAAEKKCLGISPRALRALRSNVVFVHGGGGTGRVWESTPDGREGYQTIFLRRDYAVYIVDFARRGRAGQPTFNGSFGSLDGVQIGPNVTGKTGAQFGWTRWRIGPAYPQLFPVQQFPTDQASVDQFFQSLVPTVSDNAT